MNARGLETAEPESLVVDLGFLRKNEGFSATRLDRVKLLRTLLEEDETDAFDRLQSRFASAIHSLGGSDSSLLFDVYALSEETTGIPTLRDRRAIYANRISRSVDTVADRESGAIARLAAVLVAGRYAQSPLTLDIPQMHGGLVYESTSTLVVVENRLWKETREHYRFVAEFDEMDYVTIVRDYGAKVSVPTGGQFRVNSEPASGGYFDHFWSVERSGANSPMLRGRPYDLKFILSPGEGDALTPITNGYRALHERSLLYSFQVKFIGARPSVIWRYERVSHFAQPGAPTAQNLVEIDEHGVVTLRLRDTYGGLASGIAWRW